MVIGIGLYSCKEEWLEGEKHSASLLVKLQADKSEMAVSLASKAGADDTNAKLREKAGRQYVMDGLSHKVSLGVSCTGAWTRGTVVLFCCTLY